MTTQADIDAVKTQLEADVASVRSTLQAEIDKLANNNPALDLSGLQAVDGELQALGQIQPTPPAPQA